MAPSRTSFEALTPELDQAIEDQMEAIATCDAIDELEAIEERIHEVEEHLAQRLDRLRHMRRDLTRRQRQMIRDIKSRLVGSNQSAERGRRSFIQTINVAGGTVNIDGSEHER